MLFAVRLSGGAQHNSTMAKKKKERKHSRHGGLSGPQKAARFYRLMRRGDLDGATATAAAATTATAATAAAVWSSSSSSSSSDDDNNNINSGSVRSSVLGQKVALLV